MFFCTKILVFQMLPVLDDIRALVQRESIEVFMSREFCYVTRYADHQLINAALLFLRVLLLVFFGFQMDNSVQRQQQTEDNRINLSWPRMCHYKQALPVCRMSLEKDLQVNAKTCRIAQFHVILSSYFSFPPPLCMHSSMKNANEHNISQCKLALSILLFANCGIAAVRLLFLLCERRAC
jgi:hypothetical protein